VLDFGLAKSGSKPAPTEQTLTAALTTEGSVLGTPQYMAPEQFEGKEADTRSDIWAFGAVLYEMVTGEKAFQGKSYSSLVGAILSADPRPMLVKPFTRRRWNGWSEDVSPRSPRTAINRCAMSCSTCGCYRKKQRRCRLG
jgi:serine/threonine protein kinase